MNSWTRSWRNSWKPSSYKMMKSINGSKIMRSSWDRTMTRSACSCKRNRMWAIPSGRKSRPSPTTSRGSTKIEKIWRQWWGNSSHYTKTRSRPWSPAASNSWGMSWWGSWGKSLISCVISSSWSKPQWTMWTTTSATKLSKICCLMSPRERWRWKRPTAHNTTGSSLGSAKIMKKGQHSPTDRQLTG